MHRFLVIPLYAALCLLLIDGIPLKSVYGQTSARESLVNYMGVELFTIPRRDMGPVYVDISLNIQSIPEVNLRTMEFSVVLFLHQRWHDPRLQINETDKSQETRMPEHWLSKHIWIPDVFFLNARGGMLHQVTHPNEMIWIHNNGVVIHSQKLTLRLFCPMKFWKFPMDTQICSILISSYGHSKNKLELRWWKADKSVQTEQSSDPSGSNLGVELKEELGLNEYEQPIYAFQECNNTSIVTGVFSCLELVLKLDRKYGFYIIYAYLPSSLVVLIAWLAFLVDPRAVPARVSLGLLSVIALITHNASLLVHLPNVSYIKAIDLWFFVCLAFVASTLAESVLANRMCTFASREKEDQLSQPGTGISAFIPVCKKRNRVSPEETAKTDSPQTTDQIPCQSKEVDYNLRVRWMDTVCLCAYPICFLLFNMIYWPWYASRH